MLTQNMVEETLVAVEQLADLPNLEGPCVSLIFRPNHREMILVPFGAHVHSARKRQSMN